MNFNFKKTFLSLLLVTLLAPALFFASAKPAEAIVPTATTIDIPKLLLENIPSIILFGLENAAYRGLKFLSHKLSENSANALFGEWATGEKGKLPAFDPLTWTFHAITAVESAVGGAMEGMVLGAEHLITRETELNPFKTDINNEVSTAKLLSGEAEKTRKNIAIKSSELTRNFQGFECGKVLNTLEGQETEEQKANNARATCLQTQKEIKNVERQKITEKKLSESAKRAEEKVKEIQIAADQRSAQVNVSENFRFQKFQKNAAGAFSPAALSFLKGVCSPKVGLILKIGLGIGANISDPEEPICKFKDLIKNWPEFTRNTGAAITNVTSGQNNWQLLADALDPYKSDVGVVFGLQSSLFQDQLDEIQGKKMERLENMISGGLKPVTDWAGNVLTPAGLANMISGNTLGKVTEKEPLTGKFLVDTVDILMDFVQTFVGKSVQLGFQGIRRLAADANKVGELGIGEEFTPSSVESAQLYNPTAAPSYGGAQSATMQRIAQLVKVKTSGGQMQNVLAELQMQNCNVHPNACTIGSAFANAIQKRMTVAQAMQEYRDSGGSTGLNPDGRFGFKHTSVGKPAEEPRDYQDDYPYRSMVILRKYRVLPVAWELAALYIRDNPDTEACGFEKDCTLQDLISAYNNEKSPFFRLIDPSWVLKLPPVRCELKGYGPTALEGTQDPNAEQKEKEVEAVCTTDTNGDGVIWCGDTQAPGDITVKDLKVKPSPRPEVCVDETSCLSDSADGKCDEKSAGFGYCLEEWKKFALQGTQCEERFASCDAFTEVTPRGAGRSFALLKNTVKTVYGNDEEKKTNVCKEENAGCTWLSNQARQYETCVIDIERDDQNNPIKNGKKVLMENKTGKALDNDLHDTTKSPTADLTLDTALSTQLALCQKVIHKIDSEKTSIVSRPWSDALQNRVSLTYNAPQCDESAEGCRTMGDGTNLRVAPPYLKCDDQGAFQRAECQRYALHCDSKGVTKDENVGCQLYSALDSDDPDIPAVSPQACLSASCVGIQAYFLQPSFFDPAPATSLTFFKEDQVNRCSSQETGCEEFTNIDTESKGGEARTYFSKSISCELVGNIENRTVFYSYYGSEQGGRQPVAFYFKADASDDPACAPNTSCACDASIFSNQFNNPTQPLTCREFINAAGTVSYRFIDKLVYQTDDCSEYRRAADNIAKKFISKSLSAQCSAQASGCRTYSSTTAGNYAVILRDTFEKEPLRSGWGPETRVDTSREAETVGGRSLRIKSSAGPLETKKEILLVSAKKYTLSLNAKAAPKATLAVIEQGSTDNTNTVGTADFINSGWQYFTFTFSPQNATTTSLMIRITPLSGDTISQAFIDTIFIKESQGSTVYAIDTSTKTETARPSVCEIVQGSGTYQTTCRLYTSQDIETPQPFSAFTNVCPLPFVGCRAVQLQNATTTLYLVDKPDAQCRQEDANCTSYGLPTRTREQRITDTSDTVSVLVGVASSTTANEGYKEAWQSVFYKITPEQIAQNLVKLSDASSTIVAEGYKAGACKTDEQGCKTYNTPSAKKYFKDPKNNLCFWTKGEVFVDKTSNLIVASTEAQKKAKKGQAETVINSRDGWFYKACRKKSGDFLDDQKNHENELFYPSYACELDDDCSGLDSDIYTGKCDALVSCDSFDAANGNRVSPDGEQSAGPAAYAHSFEVYNTTNSQLKTSTPTITYWNNQGPANYFKQCPSRAVGCRQYKDPECIECGEGNQNCRDPDPGKGTLRSDYGRLDPNKGMSGASCKVYRTYLNDVRDTQKECSGELNVENGCILLQDTDPDGEKAIYNSKEYYNDYFKTKRGITINTADSRNVTLTERDANILLKGKLDRECKVSLHCVSEMRAPDNRDRKICTERIPCLKRNSTGECINAAMPGHKACRGTSGPHPRECGDDSECPGSIARNVCQNDHTRTCRDNSNECSSAGLGSCTSIQVGQCVPLGVCFNEASGVMTEKRCTQDSHCSSGEKCNATPLPDDLQPYCNTKADKDECESDTDCYWNNEVVSGKKCQSSPTASLAAEFKTPYVQVKAKRLTPDKYHEIDFSFAGLSGYARPSFVFKDNKKTINPAGRDSFFFTWAQSPNTAIHSSTLADIAKADPDNRLQNTITISGEAIANSCRLYPRSDSPKERVHILSPDPSKDVWNDACNYISGTSEKFVGMYGYCLEPYPQFQNRYNREKIGKVCARDIAFHNGFCDNDDSCKETTPPADFGPCIYQGYSQACLLWNPITLANQAPSGVASANLEAQVKSYANGVSGADASASNIYYCVETLNHTSASRQVSEVYPNGSDTDNPHYLYEDISAPSGCDYKGDCETRNSRSMRNHVDDGGIDGDGNPLGMSKYVVDDKLIIYTEILGPLGTAVNVYADDIEKQGQPAPLTVVNYAMLKFPRVNLNTKETIDDQDPATENLGFNMDSIGRIEYRIDTATRDQFNDWFHKGKTVSGAGLAGGVEILGGTWNTLYSTTGPENPIAFFYDEGTAGLNTLWNYSSKWWKGSGSEACDKKKNFVVLGPEIENNRIVGWRWRYCDNSGTASTLGYWEGLGVSIKIKFKPVTVPLGTTPATYRNPKIYHKKQDEFTQTCSAFVRPVTDAGSAVGKYIQTSSGGVKGEEHPTLGAHYSISGQNFFEGNFDNLAKKSQRIVTQSRTLAWDENEFLKDIAPRHSELKKITNYGKARVSETSEPTGTPGFFTKLSESIPTFGSLTTGDLSTFNNLFAKAYEYWRWNVSTQPVCLSDHTRACPLGNSDCSGTFLGICVPIPVGRYEKTAEWNGSQFIAVGGHSAADATTLQTMWNTSRTEAQGRAPVTSPAIPDGNKYTTGSTGGFHFVHDDLLYPQVRISFWIDVPNNDQLPLRKIIVDWGDKRRSEYENSNIEGSGKNERVGPAVGATTDKLPFEFSHIYGDGQPKGKHICLYTMDNWEAKAAACGTVYKNASGWGITSWEYQHAMLDTTSNPKGFSLSPDASNTWPEADARTRYGLDQSGFNVGGSIGY